MSGETSLGWMSLDAFSPPPPNHWEGLKAHVWR